MIAANSAIVYISFVAQITQLSVFTWPIRQIQSLDLGFLRDKNRANLAQSIEINTAGGRRTLSRYYDSGPGTNFAVNSAAA